MRYAANGWGGSNDWLKSKPILKGGIGFVIGSEKDLERKVATDIERAALNNALPNDDLVFRLVAHRAIWLRTHATAPLPTDVGLFSRWT